MFGSASKSAKYANNNTDENVNKQINISAKH